MGGAYAGPCTGAGAGRTLNVMPSPDDENDPTEPGHLATAIEEDPPAPPDHEEGDDR